MTPRAAPPWRPGFLDSSPMFAPLREAGRALNERADWPSVSDLQRLAGPEVVSGAGVALEFVQAGAQAQPDLPYEQRIFGSGEVPCRPHDWHDLFNALVWLAFPRSKAALNARHVREMAREAPGKRGRARDALTLFDEIREIHMVGGVNPDLPFDYYLDVIRAMKRARPGVHVKAFTMVEIAAMAETFGLSIEELLIGLREAGLVSIPGGGAEILTDHAHQVLFKGKIDHRAWIGIATTAHRLGLRSNATMMFGHFESIEERIDHMLLLREAQDETGGFMAFIPLAFHPENTRLSHIPRPSAAEELRMVAVGRLMLDNFAHLKAYPNQGRIRGLVLLRCPIEGLKKMDPFGPGLYVRFRHPG